MADLHNRFGDLPSKCVEAHFYDIHVTLMCGGHLEYWPIPPKIEIGLYLTTINQPTTFGSDL
jgi:hypothetical protein